MQNGFHIEYKIIDQSLTFSYITNNDLIGKFQNAKIRDNALANDKTIINHCVTGESFVSACQLYRAEDCYYSDCGHCHIGPTPGHVYTTSCNAQGCTSGACKQGGCPNNGVYVNGVC